MSAAFADDPHAQRLTCIDCHGGAEGAQTKSAAHRDLRADPSDGVENACSCHASISSRHRKGLHATQNGYETILARRMGVDRLPARAHEMLDAQCASCHTSCGQCHVSRPDAVRGGFTNGHVFRTRPSQTENCTACHGSRVGDEYRGRNAGIPADVHYLSGMTCFECHDEREIHGDGSTPPRRFESPNAPSCLDCHGSVPYDLENAQHARHAEDLACQVCHAVTYKTCYRCHVGLDSRGLEVPSRMDFRIGRNAVPSEDHPWSWVVLRHVPIAPNSYADWGLELAGYTSEPTWRLATPHNIQRQTPQNASCNSCHGHDELFLTDDHQNTLISDGYMFEEEIEANADVSVDAAPAALEPLRTIERKASHAAQ